MLSRYNNTTSYTDGIPTGTHPDVVVLLQEVAPSMSYKFSLRQETNGRPPYVGICQCEVNAGKTAQQKHINLNTSKMAQQSINTTARVFNHTLSERAGHQHSDKVCGVCISSLGVEL